MAPMLKARAFKGIFSKRCSTCLALAVMLTTFPANANVTEGRPLPPEFWFASDSLFPAMHDPARAAWVLERLRPILAKFPGHAPFRQIEFWALANTSAPTGRLTALADSLIDGVSLQGREAPGRLQQATHCLELGQVLFARRESLAVAETYVRRALRYLEPTHPIAVREACEDLLAQIVRESDAASFDTLQVPSPGTGLPEPHMAWRPLHESALAQTLIGGVLAVLAGFGAQWFRGVLERRHRRAQLLIRIRGSLETAVATFNSMLKTKGDGTKELDPQTLNGIILEWKRYDRVSDDIGLLKDPRSQESIDNVLGAVRMVAEAALEDQRRFDAEVKAVGERVAEGVRLPQSTIERIHAQRRKRLEQMKVMRDTARQVLNAFNASWKPAQWHEERRIPESVDEAAGGQS